MSLPPAVRRLATVSLLCATLAATAAARLLPMSQLPRRNAGRYDHVKMVDGGMSGWVKRGWPTVRPGG